MATQHQVNLDYWYRGDGVASHRILPQMWPVPPIYPRHYSPYRMRFPLPDRPSPERHRLPVSATEEFVVLVPDHPHNPPRSMVHTAPAPQIHATGVSLARSMSVGSIANVQRGPKLQVSRGSHWQPRASRVQKAGSICRIDMDSNDAEGGPLNRLQDLVGEGVDDGESDEDEQEDEEGEVWNTNSGAMEGNRGKRGYQQRGRRGGPLSRATLRGVSFALSPQGEAQRPRASQREKRSTVVPGSLVSMSPVRPSRSVRSSSPQAIPVGWRGSECPPPERPYREGKDYKRVRSILGTEEEVQKFMESKAYEEERRRHTRKSIAKWTEQERIGFGEPPQPGSPEAVEMKLKKWGLPGHANSLAAMREREGPGGGGFQSPVRGGRGGARKDLTEMALQGLGMRDGGGPHTGLQKGGEFEGDRRERRFEWFRGENYWEAKSLLEMHLGFFLFHFPSRVPFQRPRRGEDADLYSFGPLQVRLRFAANVEDYPPAASDDAKGTAAQTGERILCAVEDRYDG
uniref:Uncharacterized protein n=1 Tax=Chromera velia CCMP2878 TaxID=1169474 RepID=A0A0G4I4H0_9ALVE|eukprot:Cvel_1809.t1-p1 / transcript=Cvel_1809.t1 / gene=Cvel_1809 / organism=Chromera_velia_CCMP2878 / gene_product=hypothetical protein / transcript_product=hypothetical protein / location=Cvel_scaffold66:123494-126997(-) / protein_length=513 / sequence_SO=supercontig / SO=protein_coding / is_pseudo=false